MMTMMVMLAMMFTVPMFLPPPMRGTFARSPPVFLVLPPVFLVLPPVFLVLPPAFCDPPPPFCVLPPALPFCRRIVGTLRRSRFVPLPLLPLPSVPSVRPSGIPLATLASFAARQRARQPLTRLSLALLAPLTSPCVPSAPLRRVQRARQPLTRLSLALLRLRLRASRRERADAPPSAFAPPLRVGAGGSAVRALLTHRPRGGSLPPPLRAGRCAETDARCAEIGRYLPSVWAFAPFRALGCPPFFRAGRRFSERGEVPPLPRLEVSFVWPRLEVPPPFFCRAG